jgi:hypothetical protein
VLLIVDYIIALSEHDMKTNTIQRDRELCHGSLVNTVELWGSMKCEIFYEFCYSQIFKRNCGARKDSNRHS